jgi:RimJ/RimL family protein N-acetyltransferase
MFPKIFAGNLVRLAASRPEDQEAFATWSQDEEYMRLLDDDPVRPSSPATFSSFGEATRGDDFYFHLRTVSDDQLIGFVVLFNVKWRNRTAELAMGIGAADFRGKGFGSDALKLILTYAFSELGLRRVSLSVLSYNAQAVKAYERAGFVLEGTQRQMVERDGQLFDLLHYGILSDEWRARRG